MAFRDKLAAQAAPYLEPGENIQAALASQTVSPYWSVVSAWIMIMKDANRAIVVTDRRILVFRTSRWRWTKFKALEASVDRRTRFGEPSGLNWKTSALGPNMWIHRRFHKDVRSADQLVPIPGVPGTATPPPPPPPAPPR